MEWSQLKIGRNDRAAVIGRTGSGKTFLARYLIEDSNKKYSVTYDAKASESIGQWGQPVITDFGELQQSNERRVIYRPDHFEASDPFLQNRFFEWVYLRQHCRLFVDEAYAVKGGTSPGSYFSACLTRGRERGISTVIGTQRPSRVPLETFSEAEHFYIFQLTWPADQQRIYELSGGLLTVEKQLTLNEHEFFYFNVFSGLHPKKIIINPI